MSQYAANTSVSEDRSRGEIEKMLLRYGADEFGYMTRRTEAVICFRYQNIGIQMSVPLPDRDDESFHTTPGGKRRRDGNAAMREWEKETRRRWRSLCLVIKSLLVGIDDGVLSFEQAFLPYIVWGNGLTTGQMLLPQISHALETGQMPGNLKQLEALPDRRKK